jgi:hypothetical protein
MADEEEKKIDHPSGVEEGTVLEVDEEGNGDIDHHEKVVSDFDSEGKVVGWHKEVVKGK